MGHILLLLMKWSQNFNSHAPVMMSLEYYLFYEGQPTANAKTI